MGTLLLGNLCAHRKGAIDELIKGRARDAAAQPQILFGKPTGDHDGPEELLVKLLTSFTESLFSHLLMSGCEHCEVISQIPNQVRSPIGDHRSVDPGESSKRPATKDRWDSYKRRCTDKHDQGCQETEQVQRIQEAPDMNPTNYFGHHTSISHSLDIPFQNPLLKGSLLNFSSMTISTQDSEPSSRSFSSKTISTQDSEPSSRSFSSKTISTQDSEPSSRSFSSKTISTQDSEPSSRSFSSKTISTQYTSSCPSSASSVRKECGEETVQSNSLSGDLLFLPSQLPQPMTAFFQQEGPHERQFFEALKAKPSSEGALRRWRKLALVLRFSMHLTEVPFQRRNEEDKRTVMMPAPRMGITEIPPEDGYTWRKYGQKEILGSMFPRGYFRCTQQKLYNCPAKKQVQRLDNDPFTYEVIYRGNHTCHMSSIAPSGSPVPTELMPPPVTQQPTTTASPPPKFAALPFGWWLTTNL